MYMLTMGYPLDRSQERPTSMAALQSYQEGVVYPNLFQENGIPSSSSYLSSIPQPLPYGYIPNQIPNNNSIAISSSVRNSANPFGFTDLPNPPPATPLNDSIPGTRPSKKFKCCNKIKRSDNMIVHLRSVHRARIPPGTRLKDWIRDHPNCTASEV